ncbi:MAG: hypothetical protein U1D30_11550 [Planctomycetota bacterium]
MLLIHVLWSVGLLAAAFSMYLVGYRRGFRAGQKSGFVNGLKRSIVLQKPTDVLCRTLMPRPLAEYGRYFASLLK